MSASDDGLKALGIDRTELPSREGKQCDLGPERGSRVLGWEWYGACGADFADVQIAANVIFLHGTPGSRKFFHPAHDKICKDRRVRVFVVERPGFGISTFQEDRTLMSFAEDVKVFAKAMGLEKYSVVGYSAGGPYALACAALKDGALNKVCIISSVGPPETPRIYEGMSFIFRVGWWMSKHWSWGVRQALKHDRSRLLQNPTQVVEDDMKSSSSTGYDSEKYAADQHIRRLFVECALDNALTENGLNSEVHEYSLFGSNWGFDLKAIECLVFQWSGQADRGSVPNIAKYFQESIPNCETVCVEEAGHLLFFEIWDDIISKLIDGVDAGVPENEANTS